MSAPLWSPSADQIAQANLTTFLARVGQPDFAALHAWSLADQGAFYSAVWNFFGVTGQRGQTAYTFPGGDVRQARYFPGAQLSYAENLLRHEGQALLVAREDGWSETYTWKQLRTLTARYQALMRAAGVGRGDRVAAMVPNCADAIALLCAANGLGAVTATASPDFGVEGAVDRFGQIEPKVFISCNGYVYGGKRLEVSVKAQAIAARLPGLVTHFEFDYLDGGARDLPPASDLALTPLPFDHPLYILFSSGTTGKPKCIVHRQGGALLKHLVEHGLHSNLKPGDRAFFFTTCGWMMWNWLITGLANGQTLQLYDGSPFHPRPRVLWELVEKNRLTYFGCGAKYIDGLAKLTYAAGQKYDLSSLKTLATTGSPLVHEAFDYAYKYIKADMNLASISGGTDIVGCFVGGLPTRPVYRGEIQAPILGMDVQIYGDRGQPLPPGQRGELVCTAPFPTMPTQFWRDEAGHKYTSSYFARFEGVWHHGDFIERTATGGYIIHGRSDATLNPGGVRIGTAEIYRQVETLPQILESVVVGQPYKADTRIVLFVKLREGESLSNDLQAEMRAKIRTAASPRHVPAVIAQVADIPKTRSGKISELAVRDAICGTPIANKGALANPEALDLFAPALASALAGQ